MALSLYDKLKFNIILIVPKFDTLKKRTSSFCACLFIAKSSQINLYLQGIERHANIFCLFMMLLICSFTSEGFIGSNYKFFKK